MTANETCTVFKYEKREVKRSKAVHVLCRSDVVFAAVQTVRSGGETNLHAHGKLDGFWFVLSGRARFYTTDDEVLADLGPREGILIPRGFPYWFESADESELELLQVEASVEQYDDLAGFGSDRTNYTPRRSRASSGQVVNDDVADGEVMVASDAETLAEGGRSCTR
jgi:mannose-6-phosphate isomerase-like protein (cupin superfamily)